MTDIVKGMLEVLGAVYRDHDDGPYAMRAALLWLAANVSDEMVLAAVAPEDRLDYWREEIKKPKYAALRKQELASIGRAIKAAAQSGQRRVMTNHFVDATKMARKGRS